MLVLKRISSQNESTIGALFRHKGVGNEFLCFVLEDEARAIKKKGETRIPAGTYDMELRNRGGFHTRYKTRFNSIHKGMIHLKDVPGFKWILMHVGNTDKDTDGCLLLCDAVHQNVTTRGSGSASVKAYMRVYPQIAEMIESGDTKIRIEDLDIGVIHD